MFGFFDSPFFYGYRPRCYVYRPRVSIFDRHIANIASYLADLLDEAPAKNQHSLEFEKKKQALEMVMRHDAHDHSETKAKAEAAANSLYGSDKAPSASSKTLSSSLEAWILLRVALLVQESLLREPRNNIRLCIFRQSH